MYKEEKFNAISHLIGAVLALAGLVYLIVMASLQRDPWKIVSFSIYGTTLLLVYLSSTFYHLFEGKKKNIFRIFDHLSIYLLIAGTYTPLTLITLKGGWGWSLFGIVWGLAIVGIFFELVFKKRAEMLAVLIYIAMGWLIAIAAKPLWISLPSGGIAWLVAGGIFYTAGVVFYASKGRIPHSHGIWHLFVLAGSFSHFLTMLYVV